MNLIFARCLNRGIVYNNKLPWFLKEELNYFSKITTGKGNNAVIMGRKTWESLPKKPLPNRFNIIITKYDQNIEVSYHYHPKVKIINSVDSSKYFVDSSNFDDVFVIGGKEIYNTFLKQNYINRIYESLILQDYVCDTYMDPLPNDFKKVSSITQVYGEYGKFPYSIQYNLWEKMFINHNKDYQLNPCHNNDHYPSCNQQEHKL